MFIAFNSNLEYQFGFKNRTRREEEATEAYILVRRGDDDEGNKVI